MRAWDWSYCQRSRARSRITVGISLSATTPDQIDPAFALQQRPLIGRAVNIPGQEASQLGGLDSGRADGIQVPVNPDL